jgi:O-antigen ligase
MKGLVIAGFSILAIVATQSRSGILFGGLLAVGYLFFPRGPGTLSAGARLGIGLGGVVLLVVIVLGVSQALDLTYEQSWRIRNLVTLDVSDGSTQDRFDKVDFAGRNFLDRFWGGTGLGGSAYYGFSPHNTYLEIGLEYGIGGLLLYLFFIMHAGIKSLRFGLKRTQTQLLILLQLVYYGFFSHTVHASPIAAVFFAAVIVNTLVEQPIQADESKVQS